MKTGAIIGAIVAVAAIGFGAYMIDIDQTEEASLPTVDLSVEGGNMPEFDADVGDIDVGTEEVTVNVPTIDVQSPEEEAAEES
ncbi:hypothetical protein [uncultured Tateyamaria sp.]|uniref:hypothetical protein n=1 Tax=uncultured Tateyamaria sp. TaxID=455651 RepID=UPI00263211F7|nr:hypothetical protein [uncultured Tateyamaria sp.]